MIKVALTGNIGSGKTTVSRIFQVLEVPVFHADEEARNLYALPEVKKEVQSVFGEDIYLPNGSLDKKTLAKLVFNEITLLNKLNHIIHPRVKIRFEQWIKQHQNEAYIIQEAAILFESNFHKLFDKIIMVTADRETRIERIIKRDHVEREDVISRMKKQLPEDQKIKMADYLIHNNGNEMLIPQVLKIHRELMT